MEAFVSRKRRKLSPAPAPPAQSLAEDDGLDSTDFKLAILASLNSGKTQDILLDYLLAYDGSVEAASRALSAPATEDAPKQQRSAATGYQSSLSSFAKADSDQSPIPRPLTKKGKTLHLYSPDDIEHHTPCTIIHNFLSTARADALLHELLAETPSFRKETFQLFDRTVESPHTMRFYVDSTLEAAVQKSEYVYNGSYVPDVGTTTPEMLATASLVQKAVNRQIDRRIKTFYPGGEKLKFQSPDPWVPNASFVNCYAGGHESVGYHSDQLTYLGPRAVIGSLSLGVAREFRVRDVTSTSEGGQIAIHLPHNSLLVMHAEMQEQWKHSVHPSATITPHPLAGNKRLNITYRCYKPYLHPKFTPRCQCGVPAVLRCVQKREKASWGRYMWMCHVGYTPGRKGCGFFVWAEFDVDGRPKWAEGFRGDANGPSTMREDKDGAGGNQGGGEGG